MIGRRLYEFIRGFLIYRRRIPIRQLWLLSGLLGLSVAGKNFDPDGIWYPDDLNDSDLTHG